MQALDKNAHTKCFSEACWTVSIVWHVRICFRFHGSGWVLAWFVVRINQNSSALAVVILTRNPNCKSGASSAMSHRKIKQMSQNEKWMFASVRSRCSEFTPPPVFVLLMLHGCNMCPLIAVSVASSELAECLYCNARIALSGPFLVHFCHLVMAALFPVSVWKTMSFVNDSWPAHSCYESHI